MNKRACLAGTVIVASSFFSGVLLAAAPATGPAMTAPAAGRGAPARAPLGPADQPATASLNATKHAAYLAKAKAGNIDLYFEGDSITDFWESRANFKTNFEKNFGGWKPGDFGISGEVTQQVLFRIKDGELDGVNPKVVVLLIGTNNLSGGVPAGSTEEAFSDELARGVEACVKAIHEKAPAAKVVLMGITTRNTNTAAARGRRGAPASGSASAPATAPASAPAVNIAPLMPLINKINGKLEAWVNANPDKMLTISYLNINDKLADKDGKLFPGMMGDGLHPTEQGYQVWADALKPILSEWLGPMPATAPK